MDEDKTCFKCGATKPRSEYYAHKKMGDGLLGKCKDCTKSDAELRRSKKMLEPEWVAIEATRHREKARRFREEGRASRNKPETVKAWRERNPEKKKAHDILNNAVRVGKLARKPCEVCGKEKSQAHHDDYSKPLDVRWLCAKHHGEAHIKPHNNLELVLKTIDSRKKME